MTDLSASLLARLVRAALGRSTAEALLGVVAVAPALVRPDRDEASREEAAMALNLLLMNDLLERVPTGAAYVAEVRRAGRTITFDHGALRTVRFSQGGNGALPNGEEAFTRILRPLGYRQAGLYPLERLRMTGRAYAHEEAPQDIPQFFVSELHVDRFSPAFQAAAARVFGASRDPLTEEARVLLEALSAGGSAPAALAETALPVIASAFGRHHDEPSVEDYEALLAESAEAAWIATEGNAFNHVTDRVPDVEALADRQRALGRPIKDAIEVSSTGRVRQTAFKADPVERRFRTAAGRETRTVPGSFYEFITRDPLPGASGLDLQFDTSNAQGIFKMTAVTS
ncbi:2-oxoadipate dioxygenase/decarboxylase family protein [Sorangium sp. So ce1128]